MALAKFNNGVSSMGLPIVGGRYLTTGNVYFVHDTGSNGNDGTDSDHPVATIDYAVGLCTANQNDFIFVMPGHTETVASAGALDLDVIGITIVGIGTGSNRPTINLTSAVTADIDVDAANITLINLLITGGVDNITSALDVNAADFTMIDCEMRDVTGQIAIGIATDANADRMRLIRLVYRGAAAAGCTEAIRIIGGDDIEIIGAKIYGNFSTAAINVATTATVRLRVYGTNGSPCYIWNANAADVAIKDTVTASTGDIGPNIYIMMTDNAANITEAVTGATFQMFPPVYACNLAGEQALQVNWTASTDA
jgi:hypothetical protein